MSQEISQALGNQYAMFYNPSVQINFLQAVQTLNGSIGVVNQYLLENGTDLSRWPAHAQDEIARLLWVNWIYQNLVSEPIRKPILVHKHNNQFCVDCGDTRLMALQLLDNPPSVSVITTCLLTDISSYSNWQRVCTTQDLINCTGFDSNTAQVFFTLAPPGTTYAFTWLEIGDPSTAHHLHNVDLRVQMMQNYLDSQDREIEFTVDWVRSQIKWH